MTTTERQPSDRKVSGWFAIFIEEGEEAGHYYNVRGQKNIEPKMNELFLTGKAKTVTIAKLKFIELPDIEEALL